MILPLPSIPNAYALLMPEEKKRKVQNTPKFHSESSSGKDHFLLILRDKRGTMITRSLILFEDIARKDDIALINVIRCMEIQLI